LTEILVENVIRSPLWLILPMLAALTTLRSWQAWINPPALPYPPGLDQSGIDLSKTLLIETKDHAEILWSAEQALRSRACSAVICWPSKLTQTEMRRLQLAAEGGDTLGICFRNETALRQHSMATLRMRCYELPNGMEIDFLKCRGGPLHQNISIHRLRGNTSVTINT
jgi:cell division inhibitor SulA/protein ImuA